MEASEISGNLTHISHRQRYILKNVINPWEHQIQTLAKMLLRRGDVVIDVGANIGALSVFFSEIVGSAGKVVAIEPNPRLAKEFAQDFGGLDKFPNIVLINKASFSKSDVLLKLSIDDSFYSSASSIKYQVGKKSILVNSISIDSIANEPIKLIKIDVEGAEEEVIQGALETIKKYLPFIIFETGQNPQEIERFFDKTNITGYRFLEVSSLNPYQTEFEKRPNGLYNVIAVPNDSVGFEVISHSIKSSNESVVISPGLYSIRVKFEDPNHYCTHKLAVLDESNDFIAFFQSTLDHLSHPTNSTFLFNFYEETRVKPQLEMECGKQHNFKFEINMIIVNKNLINYI